MRLATAGFPLFIAATATLVAGQSTKKCAAQNVVDRCVMDMQFQLESCATYDFECQCIHSTNVVDCYNNCPDLVEGVSAQTVRQQACANAKAYATTTTLAAAPSMTADSQDSAYASASVSPTSGPHSSLATGTPSGLEENNADSDSSDDVSGSSPTKSLTGLQEDTTSSATPTSGAAVHAAKGAGAWVAFLGLAFGVLF